VLQILTLPGKQNLDVQYSTRINLSFFQDFSPRNLAHGVVVHMVLDTGY
jgi:hypothetical protein